MYAHNFRTNAPNWMIHFLYIIIRKPEGLYFVSLQPNTTRGNLKCRLILKLVFPKHRDGGAAVRSSHCQLVTHKNNVTICTIIESNLNELYVMCSQYLFFIYDPAKDCLFLECYKNMTTKCTILHKQIKYLYNLISETNIFFFSF